MPLARRRAPAVPLGYLPRAGLVRLNEIIAPQGPIPLSRSTWLAGVRAGKFPQPVRLSSRALAWRVTDIQALVDGAPPSTQGFYGSRRLTDVELAWRNWVATQPATHAVTLAYNNILRARRGQLPVTRRIPIGKVGWHVDRLHRNLDRRLLGARYTGANLRSCRTSYIGFIENAEDNLHVHLHWTVPVTRGNEFQEFESLVPYLWRELTDGYGSAHVDLIRDAGWAEYALKDQFGAALEDPSRFVSSRSPG